MAQWISSTAIRLIPRRTDSPALRRYGNPSLRNYCCISICVAKVICGLSFGDANGQLADVFAAIQLEQRLGESLDAIDDMLARFELTGGHPAEHFAGGLGEAAGVVEHDEAFH